MDSRITTQMVQLSTVESLSQLSMVVLNNLFYDLNSYVDVHYKRGVHELEVHFRIDQWSTPQNLEKTLNPDMFSQEFLNRFCDSKFLGFKHLNPYDHKGKIDNNVFTGPIPSSVHLGLWDSDQYEEDDRIRLINHLNRLDSFQGGGDAIKLKKILAECLKEIVRSIENE